MAGCGLSAGFAGLAIALGLSGGPWPLSLVLLSLAALTLGLEIGNYDDTD